VFRHCDFSMYNVEDWNKPRKLPCGVAAVSSFAGAFGIIVPSMSQAWYTGPIARIGTGDIGILTGFVVAGMLYLVSRTLERRWMKTKWLSSVS
jgi:purine-cytosine permease-like protein